MVPLHHLGHLHLSREALSGAFYVEELENY